MTTLIQLMQLTCVECGCVFAVNEWWMKNIDRDTVEVFCPCGHRNQYEEATSEPTALKLTEDNERLRRELAQAIHDADQKAAAMEGRKGIMVGAHPPLPSVRPPPSGPHCPTCGKAFKKWAEPLHRHLEREHGFTTDQAKEVISRGMFPGAYATETRDLDDVPDTGAKQ